MFGMHGYFDWRVIAIAGAVLRPGDIAVEVGANVGTETVALADLVGTQDKVFAIEPLPSNLERLRTLNDASGLRQVEVLPYAVSDSIGVVRFSPPADRAHSGIGHIVGRDEAEALSIEVPCSTVDTLVGDHGPIRLMCIDVEGAELGVLRGGRVCLTRDHPVLILEACAPHLRRFGYGLADLHAELRSQGYRVYQVTKLGLSEPDLRSDDYSNWCALSEPVADLVGRVRRRFLACGLLPCLPGINPLTRRALP
jgi:FkbM family methyltransferase